VNRAAGYEVAPGHKPPVLDGWSDDLSYDYYARMLGVIADHYRPIRLREAVEPREPGKPLAIMRHDVDVCPRAALAMAKLEKDHRFPATYFFLINSPLYSVSTPQNAAILSEIAGMGHEVALHFDLEDEPRIGGCTLEVVEQEIAKAAALVEAASGEPVRSVSFHRPIDAFLRGPLVVAGLVNAYARELMAWYMSDSNGWCREGEPIPLLMKPRGDILQFLIHPIWWGEQHMCYEDRLAAYHSQQQDPDGDLDQRLFRGIGLKRRPS
jgi:peptidoglycan/xylan/chitin deacetylase (PgdA/CDA1 family)